MADAEACPFIAVGETMLFAAVCGYGSPEVKLLQHGDDVIVVPADGIREVAGRVAEMGGECFLGAKNFPNEEVALTLA